MKCLLRFTSLVPPNVTYSGDSEWFESSPKALSAWRVTFKKSYALIFWLKYLSTGTNKSRNLKSASLAILPQKRSKYTLTKAPMAHKTNSKEQYNFIFYNFTFSYTFQLAAVNISKSAEQGGYILLTTHKLFPVFETNLLFLKFYKISYPLQVKRFLTQLT